MLAKVVLGSRPAIGRPVQVDLVVSECSADVIEVIHCHRRRIEARVARQFGGGLLGQNQAIGFARPTLVDQHNVTIGVQIAEHRWQPREIPYCRIAGATGDSDKRIILRCPQRQRG